MPVLLELGYSCFACSSSCGNDVKKGKGVYLREDIVTDSSNVRRTARREDVDIVSIEPKTEVAFSAACGSIVDIDIIKLDMTSRLSFPLRRAVVKQALRRDLYFEIYYSTALTDQSTRKFFMSNAMQLVRATGGRNIILCSCVPVEDLSLSANSEISKMFVRAPEDVCNLGVLMGLTPKQARDALGKNCKQVLHHAKSRKVYRGVVAIEEISDHVEEEEEKSKPMQPKKRRKLSSEETSDFVSL